VSFGSSVRWKETTHTWGYLCAKVRKDFCCLCSLYLVNVILVLCNVQITERLHKQTSHFSFSLLRIDNVLQLRLHRHFPSGILLCLWSLCKLYETPRDLTLRFEGYYVFYWLAIGLQA
jgi:hypothetical protein